MAVFYNITPEEAGVSSRNLLCFIDAIYRKGLEVHSFIMARGNNIFAKGWYEPYQENCIHPMYSFTKSLTSIAVGFAVQEGLLSIREKVVDIFPEYVREDTPENIKETEIYHLLTMTTGHATEPATFGASFVDDFINHPAPYKPGTHFFYNSQGTNVLCAVLKKRTGLGLLDYLRPRLFDKIGIGQDIDCSKLGDGSDMGGGGSRLRTEDMFRFMCFVMNKGKWNGEQLLDPKWLSEACSRQISTEGEHPEPNSDWNCGYGYQFWMATRPGVYRADGAYGQIGIAMPDKDALVIMTMATERVPEVVQLIWQYIYDPMDGPLPPDTDAYSDLCRRISSLSIESLTPGVSHNGHGITFPPLISGKLFVPTEKLGFFDLSCIFFYGNAEPDVQITGIGLEYDKHCCLLLKTEDEMYRLPVGIDGHYLHSTFRDDVIAICGRWRTTHSFEMDLRPIKRMGGVRLIMRFSGKDMLLQRDYTLLGGFHEPEYEPLMCTGS